jgi:hypothetical protein
MPSNSPNLPHPFAPPLASTNPPKDFEPFLTNVAGKARAAGVFGEVHIRTGDHGGVLICEAANSAEPADYRVLFEHGKVFVSLTTQARWLSQSIEADLVHTGDKLDELIEEELVNLGWDATRARPTFEHFRDPDKLYTFRTPVPVPLDRLASGVDVATTWLLAYEACFRQLGDMDADESDD